jgi:hypothetical protein
MKPVSMSCHVQRSVAFLVGEEVAFGRRDASSGELLKPALIATGVIVGEVNLDLMRERLRSHESRDIR